MVKSWILPFNLEKMIQYMQPYPFLINSLVYYILTRVQESTAVLSVAHFLRTCQKYFSVKNENLDFVIGGADTAVL